MGDEEPVHKKTRLDLRNGLTVYANMGIAPLQAGTSVVVTVCQVHSSQKSPFTIDDQQLSVISVIDHSPKSGEAHFPEGFHLSSGNP